VKIMSVKRDTINLEKKDIINKLYETYRLKKKNIFRRLAEILKTPSRNLASVNLSKFEKLKNVVDGSVVVVPGKVLGVGELSKKITIYAYQYSSTAKTKFKNIKNLDDFCDADVDFKKIIIIK